MYFIFKKLFIYFFDLQILLLFKKFFIINKNILKDSKIFFLICRLVGRDENDDLLIVINFMVIYLGYKGEIKFILFILVGKDRSQKKRVKFVDEVLSFDNEFYFSIIDIVGDIVFGELELEVGLRLKFEFLYK